MEWLEKNDPANPELLTLPAGAEDRLDEPPAELQSATEGRVAFVLAVIHQHLGAKDWAGRWYDRAAAWQAANLG